MKLYDSVEHDVYYRKDKSPEAVQPYGKVLINTSVGPLVPVYETEDFGRNKLMPIRYDKEGNIKSIPLQESTPVSTSCGVFGAELVTFYSSGALCRLFPLNGKLSGFWSEKNESELAEKVTIPTPVGDITVKPIYLHFYETGELKSITFWPEERAVLSTPVGSMDIKRGVSFHRNGSLASCEPSVPTMVETPEGAIIVFDPDPNGMNGEKNSLSFDEEGNLVSLATIDYQVKAHDPDYGEIVFCPELTTSMCSDIVKIRQPLFIDFQPGHMQFRHHSGIIGRVSRKHRIELKRFETPVGTESAQCCII